MLPLKLIPMEVLVYQIKLHVNRNYSTFPSKQKVLILNKKIIIIGYIYHTNSTQISDCSPHITDVLSSNFCNASATEILFFKPTENTKVGSIDFIGREFSSSVGNFEIGIYESLSPNIFSNFTR